MLRRRVPEAIFIQGLFPYVAILLVATGETRASIAGLVIAAFGFGGVIYSFAIPALIARVAERRLMVLGGGLAAVGMMLAAAQFPWYAQAGAFLILGFGFYLLHGSIQVHVTELSPIARGTAASLHSCFFYLGQATGPVVYNVAFAHGEGPATMVVGAVVGGGRRADLRTAAAASDIPLKGLSHAAKLPIIGEDGLGCRASCG